jgi:hypothetical protein
VSLTPPSAAELLDVWERGNALDPTRRALLLLAAASPDETYEALAQLPIGARNAQLLELRARLFGEALVAVTDCPQCGERLEIEMRASELGGETHAPAAPLDVRVDGYALRVRLPNSMDLLAVANESQMTIAREKLFERCLVEIQSADPAPAVASLPAFILDAVSEQMAQADPQANLELALTCPNCAHAWQTPLDPIAFLWGEIDAWAQRVLREVHALASAYGWREQEILALSPQRRQIYLEMIYGER